MPRNSPSKTGQVPVTPLTHMNLSGQDIEPLFRVDLTALALGGEPAVEWSKLPLSEQRYKIDARFAYGGVGSLYAATDKVLARKVAIKVLRREQMGDPTAVVRFLQEARIHSHLQHPGIPPMYEVGRLGDGRPFLAMKFVQGRTLTAHVKALPYESDQTRYRQLFKQVCLTVRYAHTKGVIHRDLKPGNVLVSDRGRVYLIDWGLAKVVADPPAQLKHSAQSGDTTVISIGNLSNTDEGVALGTPAYMPPELTRGSAASVQSDVFGLGGILCFILTGRPPFTRGTSTTLERVTSGNLSSAYARLNECGASPDLVALAKACLSADPTERPNSVTQIIRQIADDAPNRTRPAWWKKFFGRKSE